MLKLATLLNVEGRTKQAEPLARKAYSIAWDAGDEEGKAGVALNEIGVGLMRDREYARAEPVLRRSVALLQKVEGEDSMNAARTENNLATLYSNQHEYDKAEKEMKRALPVYEKHLGPNHPELVPPLTNLCAILLQNHHSNECEPYLRRGLAIAQEAFPNSVQMAALQEESATLETVRGNYREAGNTVRKGHFDGGALARTGASSAGAGAHKLCLRVATRPSGAGGETGEESRGFNPENAAQRF